MLGGIGFTWEHDAHLYLRRALALRQLLGGSGAWRARAAQLALAGARRRLGVNLAGRRGRARADRSAPGRWHRAGGRRPGRGGGGRGAAAGPAARRARRRRLRSRPHWPPPYGLAASRRAAARDRRRAEPGRGVPAGPGDRRLGRSRPSSSTARRPSASGSPGRRCAARSPGASCSASRRQARIWPRCAPGRSRRPGAGGSPGRRCGPHWPGEADWAICLARTDPAAPKHHGLTYFLVDMHSAGIDIRPLREITGRAMFNEVFLDQVFVPDDCVVGEPGDGWRVARTTLAAERVAMGRGSALGDAGGGTAGAVRRGGPGSDPGAGGAARRAGGRGPGGVADGPAPGAGAAARRRSPGCESAVRKLVGVAHRQAVAETALTLCGPDGAAADGPAAEAVDGVPAHPVPEHRRRHHPDPAVGGRRARARPAQGGGTLSGLHPRRDPAGGRGLAARILGGASRAGHAAGPAGHGRRGRTGQPEPARCGRNWARPACWRWRCRAWLGGDDLGVHGHRGPADRGRPGRGAGARAGHARHSACCPCSAGAAAARSGPAGRRRRGRDDAHRRAARAVRPDAAGTGHHRPAGRRPAPSPGIKIGVPYAARGRTGSWSRPALTAGGTGVVVVEPGRRRREHASARTARPASPSTRCGWTRPPSPMSWTAGGGAVADLYQLAVAGACCLADGALAAALGADHGAHRVAAAVRPAAGDVPGGRAADRRRVHRAPHAAPGHAVGVLAAADRARRRPRPGRGRLLAGRAWRSRRCAPAITCTAGLGMDVSYPLHRYSAR